jgi:hypothetical protein
MVYGIILSAAGGNRGFGTISEQPAEKGMLAIRSVVKVTLAGDHRANGLIEVILAANNYLQKPESL